SLIKQKGFELLPKSFKNYCLLFWELKNLLPSAFVPPYRRYRIIRAARKYPNPFIPDSNKVAKNCNPSQSGKVV
ncbi:MAG: hypothetical protein COV69_01855, partial [Parcubacteria group bacterium CG11_big_fil_rev_8_21_14_0_20_39_14]